MLALVLALLTVIQITQFLFVALSLLVILTVYVDNILLTGSNSTALAEMKEYLKCHFVTKNMGKSKYFLGIEVAHKNMDYFWLKENMHLIYLRKHVFWGANLLAL